MAAPIYEGQQLDFNATDRHRGARHIFDRFGRLIVRFAPKGDAYVIADAQSKIVTTDPDEAEELVDRWERFGGCPVPKVRNGQSA